MILKIQSFNHMLFLLTVLLLTSAVIFPIHGLDSRKLDETPVPGPFGEKCNPCGTSPPPLPPPSPVCPPPPPPPSPVCPPPPQPALPPPSPKKPPSGYCPPPPPPPSYIYVTGPPGNVYPIDEYFGRAGRASSVGWSVLIGCGILALLVRL